MKQHMDLKALQTLIGEWADHHFPRRTPHSTLVKFLEEVAELFADPTDVMEAADVAILIVDFFHLIGADMEQAIIDKMTINKGRTWKVNPKTGIMRHVDHETVEDVIARNTAEWAVELAALNTPLRKKYQHVDEPSVLRMLGQSTINPIEAVLRFGKAMGTMGYDIRDS